MNTKHSPLILAAALAAATSPALADEAFNACLGGLRGDAAAKGITAATFDQHTRNLAPDMSVIPLLDSQPEFKTPIWDYLAGLVDDERVADGQALMKEHANTLAAVESRFGVDPATVVAVWGVESNFGRTAGKRPLVTSLATLSCFGRRQPYFRGEFFSTLKIIQEGHVTADRLVGSWAGAFGQTQFMPSTFLRTAVDFDGDGRRDVVDNAADALGSTANYLKKAGWRTGDPWGFEVRLPKGMDESLAGRTKKRPMAEWTSRGITRVDGQPLPNQDAALFLPAGPNGPAFLVMRNFDAIYAYNAAESYALAIAHLSDRLRGGKPFATPWPTDDPGLGRGERREVQNLLLQRGYAIGEADGIIGDASREAIKAEQRKLGLAADGRAGRKFLDTLKRAR